MLFSPPQTDCDSFPLEELILREGCIKAQGTLKHDCSFPWVQFYINWHSGVRSLIFSQGIWLLEGNNPHSVYLILVHFMGLPNILADCFGSFSPGSKLGKWSFWWFSHLQRDWEILSLFPCPLPYYITGSKFSPCVSGVLSWCCAWLLGYFGATKFICLCFSPSFLLGNQGLWHACHTCCVWEAVLLSQDQAFQVVFL